MIYRIISNRNIYKSTIRTIILAIKKLLTSFSSNLTLGTRLHGYNLLFIVPTSTPSMHAPKIQQYILSLARIIAIMITIIVLL